MRWPFMLRTTHEKCCDAWSALADDFEKRYERIQGGYDQGVLEGKRQAYVNVRASLADQLFNSTALRSIAPLLQDLGAEETRLLDEMKGQCKDREEFYMHLQHEPAINMFPENKPQRAEHLGDTPVKAPSPGEEEK